MSPLSIWLYYSRNKRRALPVLGILVLAVFGISLTLVLTGTMFDSARAFVSPFFKLVVVEPNYNKKVSQIDPALRAELYRNPHVAALLPTQIQRTYGVALGNQTAYPIFAIEEEEMAAVLTATQDRLVDGRLPSARGDEVALHSTVAKSRGLWVGSQIGRDVDGDDRINGKWSVVGILDGEAVLNLMPLSRATRGRAAPALLVLPKPSEMGELVKDLDALRNVETLIETAGYWDRFIVRVMSQIDTLVSIVNIVIVIVLSLGVGLLNVIYFRQRISEFGLLRGIGYSNWFLARRVALEALTITILAWMAGIGLSALVYQFLNAFVFEPQGTTLSMLNARALGGTLPVPVFVWVFSTLTVAWQLRRLDPVAIIDRRD